MEKPIKVVYDQITDRHGIDVVYYIKIRANDKKVEWGFHPILPEGMHWKKGDETGIGFDHYDSSQSFNEFETIPTKKMPDADYQKALRIIRSID
ncbi:hypothetical protein [Portibacter lacus]|uniref:Uncharacterized protein n=1 Tax=Portibacter lacus TaxID=1099794 RepID=A0AA37SR32_9BACT|nr:hypothetical protein [Portibacter lacus]GLR18437.1 hypothetical protein GCM10007940_30530 [Portibacter lacus]